MGMVMVSGWMAFDSQGINIKLFSYSFELPATIPSSAKKAVCG